MSPIIIRPYMPPVAGRPLKLIVHPDAKYDPQKMALSGIERTLDIEPERFNVLEICSDPSYTTVNQDNRIMNMSYTYFYDETFIRQNRLLLDGVDDIVMMGGKQDLCIRMALMSTIAIKVPGTINMFIGDTKEYLSASDNLSSINALNIKNSGRLNIHFNLEACYLYNDKAKDVGAFADGVEDDIIPNAMFMQRKEMFDHMRIIHTQILMDARKKTRQILDGALVNSFRAENRKHYAVTFFYWSSTEKLAEYLAKH